MVLGFSETWRGEPTHFVERILNGRKWHTLRWGNRWSEGRTIQFATGVRTKAYRMFAEDACLCTQGVKAIPGAMDPAHPNTYLPRIMVKRGRLGVLIPLAPFEVMALAINDGFDSAYDLNRWLVDSCRERKADAFRGQIVMWNLTQGPRPTPY